MVKSMEERKGHEEQTVSSDFFMLLFLCLKSEIQHQLLLPGYKLQHSDPNLLA